MLITKNLEKSHNKVLSMKKKQHIELFGILADISIKKNGRDSYRRATVKLAAYEQFETGNSALLSVVVWHTLLLRNEIAYYASVHLQKGHKIKVNAIISYTISESGGRKKVKTEISTESITLLN